jgi:hypothetical protein
VKRPFRLADGMVLIAATAVAFAIFRQGLSGQVNFSTFGGSVEQWLFFWMHQVVPFPAMWSLAVFGIAVRDGRRGRRRIPGEAGVVACCAAVVALTLTTPPSPASVRIEDGLGTGINFFHPDCVSSEVRLNVDLDATLTVLANGCCRWLAHGLKGFERMAPKQLYRKFVETAGEVEIQADRVQVRLDRRCHNPILREAGLDRQCLPIPWLGDPPVAVTYE